MAGDVKLTTKIRWFFFGKTEEERRRDEAAVLGVPFEDRTFWPAFYVFDKTPLKNGASHWVNRGFICPELYEAKIGDVVPIFSDGERVFNYRVLGLSWAAGDDHIVSPRQFHIQFAALTRSQP